MPPLSYIFARFSKPCVPFKSCKGDGCDPRRGTYPHILTFIITRRAHVANLPSDDLVGEVLVDQLEVVVLEVLNLGLVVGLGVQVVRVEGLDGVELEVVAGAHHPPVGAGAVPGVEGVESDHGEGLFGQGGLILDHMVQVLVVAP